jgi:hypothetical protein
MSEQEPEGRKRPIHKSHADPSEYDPFLYMVNESDQAVQDTRRGFGDMQRTIHDPTKRVFWYMKNPWEGHRWEEYHYDDSKIWLFRDTTAPQGPNAPPGTAYDVEPWDGLWIPRRWSLGEETQFNVVSKYFNHLESPCPTLTRVAWPNGRHRLRYVGPIDLKGDLEWQDVLVFDRYHDMTVDPASPREAERFWYARKDGRSRGWVRFEHWMDRTMDDHFDSSLPADLLATTPLKRVDMNMLTDASQEFEPIRCGRPPFDPPRFPGPQVPVLLHINPREWHSETSWSAGGPTYIENIPYYPPPNETPRHSWIQGKGVGKFVYRFSLPMDSVGIGGFATVTARMSSSVWRRTFVPIELYYSDVLLTINGAPVESLRVVGLDIDGLVSAWRQIPMDYFLAGQDANQIEFRVGGGLPNGLTFHFEARTTWETDSPIEIALFPS